MLEFTGIIFDIDGTLTSTNQLIFDSFNFVAKKYTGNSLTEKQIIALFGPPEDVVLKKLTNEEESESVKYDYYNFYQKNHKKMAALYPGIRECLQIIKEADIPLGIFTGKGRVATEITLSELSVRDYFYPIVTGDDVTRHKPGGEGIELFLHTHNLKPENVLMIGDSVHDAQASKETGVRFAAALWDSYGKADVEKLNPEFKFYDVFGLYNFLSKQLAKH